jgi:aminomethyltransferase
VTDPVNQDLQSLTLDAFHRAHGGKMVPFAGYEMPIQYPAGIIEEHKHTRQSAGLFDVSHMGQLWLHGEDAIAALESIVPGDIQNLAVGRSRYTMLTNATGGIIDDLIVTKWDNRLYVVVNASRKDVDLPLIAAAVDGKAEMEIISDRALLALQGPKAIDVLSRHIAADIKDMPFMSAVETTFDGIPCHLTRSGYTGEDGCELSIPTDAAETIANALVKHDEVMPIGLGARDTLRLEAGLCLYGNDLDETTSPIEADLRWTISKRRREAADFPGADRVMDELAGDASRKRVGLVPEGRAPAREGTVIHTPGGDAIGIVTSGGFGPSVEHPIAMGYVPTDMATEGTKVELAVRKKMVPATVTKMPFQPHQYFRGS